MRVLLTLIFVFSSLPAFTQVMDDFQLALKKAECTDLLQDKIERIQVITLPVANEYKEAYLIEDQVLDFLRKNQVVYISSFRGEVTRSASLREYGRNKAGGDCDVAGEDINLHSNKLHSNKSTCKRLGDIIGALPSSNHITIRPGISLSSMQSVRGTGNAKTGESTIENLHEISMGVHFNFTEFERGNYPYMSRGVLTSNEEINNLLSENFGSDDLKLSFEINAEISVNSLKDSFNNFNIQPKLLGHNISEATVPSHLASKVCNKLYQYHAPEAQVAESEYDEPAEYGGSSEQSEGSSEVINE